MRKARRADGSRLGDIVLLKSILDEIEVVPKFSEVGADCTCYNVREKGTHFYLNHFCDPEVFYRFEL